MSEREATREAIKWLREEESTFRLFWESPAKTAERSPEADARRRRMYEVRATALRLAERGAAIEEGS